MKRVSTIFLQSVIVLHGLMTLVILIRFPLYEGRNMNATLTQVYLQDPFLAYMYIAFISVFVAYYQAFIFLTCVRKNRVFTAEAVSALRRIKYCAMTFIGFMLGAEAYFLIIMRGKDDIAGGVMMGLVVILISTVVAVAAGIFEQILQSALELKSGNDPR
jgi:hypothetical protein